MQFDDSEDEESTAAPAAEPGRRAAKLALILERIGWRSASDAPAAVVATELDHIFSASISRGWDAAKLRAAVAESLRQHAHPLDGSSSPVTAWYPSAAEIIRREAE